MLLLCICSFQRYTHHQLWFSIYTCRGRSKHVIDVSWYSIIIKEKMYVEEFQILFAFFSAFVKHWLTETVKISVFQDHHSPVKDDQWRNSTYVSIKKKLASILFKKLVPLNDYRIKKKESIRETPKKKQSSTDKKNIHIRFGKCHQISRLIFFVNDLLIPSPASRNWTRDQT